jgi:hypothetical protein
MDSLIRDLLWWAFRKGGGEIVKITFGQNFALAFSRPSATFLPLTPSDLLGTIFFLISLYYLYSLYNRIAYLALPIWDVIHVYE